MTNLDPRIDDEVQMEPKDDVKEWQLGADGQNTQLGRGLSKEESEKLRKKLIDNRDLFAWTTEDM